MIKDYDKELGPGGWYAWPADVDVAGRFLEAAPYSKSSAECLDDDFFGDYLDCLDAHLFYNYPEEEAAELAEAEAKSRQELLKDAKNWPLPYLVASAVYKILSTQGIDKSSDFWSDFLWPFLVFDEPLFDMLRSKGWDKVYQNKLRKEFKFQLSFEIRGVTLNKLVWGSDREKPWFTCQGFTSHIYPEDLLRCFDLVGIDPDLARSTVNQVFKLQSLTPFYDVLSDDPSLMPAILVDVRDEGEETASSKKSSPGLRTYLFRFAYKALLFAGAAMAFTRVRPPLRLPRYNWALVQTQPGPCFAATRRVPNIGRGQRHSPSGSRDSPSSEQHSHVSDITASASQQSRSRPILAAVKNKALLPNRLFRAGWSKLQLARKESSDRLFRQNTAKRWDLVSALALNSQSSTLQSQPSVDRAEQPQPLRKTKSVAQVVKEVYHQLSDETLKLYKKIAERGSGWVDNIRILSDDSQEVKNFRAKLNTEGKELPDGTVLYFHAEKTKEDIVVTTPGTSTSCCVQRKIMDLAEKYLLIRENDVEKNVTLGPRHENDHVTTDKIAQIFDLRKSKPTSDTSSTVKLPSEIHQIRTTYYANQAKGPLFSLDLKDLTKPLSLILKPFYDADKALWESNENRKAILNAGLRGDVLAPQYEQGHKVDLEVMGNYLEDVMGFHPNQATAFVVDGIISKSIKLSAGNFTNFASTLKTPELEDTAVEDTLTLYQKTSARGCYEEKLRLYNVRPLNKYFSKCIELLNCLELHSQSSKDSDGRTQDGNLSQTKHHRATKREAIYKFEKALKKGLKRGLREGELAETYVETEVDTMLSLASVDKDGTSKAGPLTPEEVKGRICDIWEELKMNNLYMYTKKSLFSMVLPLPEKRKEMYKGCVESAALKPRETSILSQQESSESSQQESSDQSNVFLQ